jgi:phospholipase/carboxylesterase
MLTIHIKEADGLYAGIKALGCIIWLHGLGGNGADMLDLAKQTSLAALPLRHVFVDAPVRPITLNNGINMQAWYDILGFKLSDREDRAGILTSKEQVIAVINHQIDAGFSANQIFLAGFSQGGAMALYTALHCGLPLKGVVALSSYLPLALECQAMLSKDTPIFIGAGQYDTVVLPSWTKLCEQWLTTQGYHQLSYHQYSMEHSVCPEELADLTAWFLTNLEGALAV